MGLQIGQLMFNGPFTTHRQMHPVSGVYVISVQQPNGTHTVIDVGESENIQARIANHDRRDQWARCAGNSTVYGSTYYCDEPTRMVIEKQIRTTFTPVCGIR